MYACMYFNDAKCHYVKRVNHDTIGGNGGGGIRPLSEKIRRCRFPARSPLLYTAGVKWDQKDVVAAVVNGSAAETATWLSSVREEFASSEHSSTAAVSTLPPPARQKRLRTSFKHHQLRVLKTYFALNHNPDAKDLKQLSQKTGLGKRILQVRDETYCVHENVVKHRSVSSNPRRRRSTVARVLRSLYHDVCGYVCVWVCMLAR